METLTVNWDVYLGYITIAISIASIIVKATPNETDNKYLVMFIKFMEVVGLNTKPISHVKDTKSNL